VTITFQIPNPVLEEKLKVEAPAPVQGPQVLAGRAGVTGGTLGGLVTRPQVVPPPEQSPALAEINAQQQALMSQLRDAMASQDSTARQQVMDQMKELSEKRLALEKIGSIQATGLSDQVRDELLRSLPVHIGDAPTAENMTKLKDAVKQFDEHLAVSSMQGASPEEVEVRISLPGAGLSAQISVGGRVQEANLTKKVLPVYPALARSTRIQGHVILGVVIGTDGTVQEIKLVSGHPLLAASAMEAVKQWVYKPTLLNGEAVTVATEVDVNFSLE
jgi:TonB family protein